MLQSQKFEIRAAELVKERVDVHTKLASADSLRKERLRYLKTTCDQLEAAVSSQTKRMVHIVAHTWH